LAVAGAAVVSVPASTPVTTSPRALARPDRRTQLGLLGNTQDLSGSRLDEASCAPLPPAVHSSRASTGSGAGSGVAAGARRQSRRETDYDRAGELPKVVATSLC